MINTGIEGVILTTEKMIDVTGGNVFHAMKRDEAGFAGFGEAYFSTIEYGAIKAWKRHREMTLNLVVPFGVIRFVIFDNRVTHSVSGVFQEFVLSRENYYRLTVPPMVWLGFQGISKEAAILLNIASIPHDPEESDRKAVEEIEFDWSLK